MEFEIDKQTLDDLDIFEAFKKENSMFAIFNQTKTFGGKNRLIDIFSYPLSDEKKIQERIDAILFFERGDSHIELDKQTIDFVEHYLSQGNCPARKKSYFRAIEDAFVYKLKPTDEYYIIERGIDYLVDLLNVLMAFYARIDVGSPSLLLKHKESFMQALSKEEMDRLLSIKDLNKIGAGKLAEFDYIFRYKNKKQIRTIIDCVYEYDVFMSVAQVKKAKGYVYPSFLPDLTVGIEIEGMYHPFLKEPVMNDVCMSENENMIFITGPNMAGKSTFLKSLGIVVYLAHIGFPVPAQNARISVLRGMATTINLSDNIDKQQSHFYAEVLRIKDVAEKIKEKKRMLIIFDELFRGTNVKDASDGSCAVISAFSNVRSSLFAVSTHIYEIADKIGRRKNVLFRCFSANNRDGVPEYTYTLKEGVTEDRLGMYIINKEKVVETINSIN